MPVIVQSIRSAMVIDITGATTPDSALACGGMPELGMPLNGDSTTHFLSRRTTTPVRVDVPPDCTTDYAVCCEFAQGKYDPASTVVRRSEPVTVRMIDSDGDVIERRGEQVTEWVVPPTAD